MDTRDPEGQDPRRMLVDHAVSLGMIVLVIALAYKIFTPLFPAILWGALLAVVCAHPYERLVARLHGRRNLADIVFALVLMMVLLVPAIFFAWEIVAAFPVASDWIAIVGKKPVPPPPSWLTELPVVGASIASAWGTATTDLGTEIPGILSHLGGVAAWAASRVGTFGAFVFEFVLGAIVALFILHNRFAVRAFINRLLVRLGGAFAGDLFVQALETTRTAFAGVIYASIAQTLLAGIGLYVAGISALVLFCGFTFLLALVQVGPLLILLVAVGILLSKGAYLAAIGLSVWFLTVVMTVDNLIRPYFSTQASSLPGIIAFLGTIGGFLTWGLIGIFVGPVLTSVIYELLLAWMDPEPEAGG